VSSADAIVIFFVLTFVGVLLAFQAGVVPLR
jgi:hypothetical protein